MLCVRPEREGDAAAIRRVVYAAFEHHTAITEHRIVDALRQDGALSVSLVAVEAIESGDGEVVGHVALSPVQVDGNACGWYGLGPVAVRPDRQGRGYGKMLVARAIEEARGSLAAAGLVVLGEPAFYGKWFGFATLEGLTLEGVPADHFMGLCLLPPHEDHEGRISSADDGTTVVARTAPPCPVGKVTFHPGFSLS
ncbi:GCN5related N-acetyltransferase [Acanthamoeba castellanii str. Neff]|uniref:GCN5related N-acetyltransferase n=1 Tax=Acanthamoeba castellanii (strain ATCC 30010 / Neff) TaxID=1257118 RepID=L8HFC0_ACACF|nr:GCN5related N-acetyltransferase [Acanthamoeba castellanii str. Neff]ELR23870.1 GCN5related N-acetyltransferase [Acanthamoeba castellanii str. Neff]